MNSFFYVYNYPPNIDTIPSYIPIAFNLSNVILYNYKLLLILADTVIIPCESHNNIPTYGF